MSIAASLRTGPFIEDEECLEFEFANSKCILKSRENILRPKCNKSRKKKLKQYKLRKDGQEDPMVIEIAQSFHKYLKIRSSNQSLTLDANGTLESDELFHSTNYIIKMVRKKEALLKKMKDKCKKRETSQTPGQSTESDIVSFNKSIDKKEKNAFKVLMDSRNTIIGSNSPGKDREENGLELEETILKKANKAKRNLALQKLAEAKGSIQKQELEEQQEKYVKRKMDKRAERLKNLISKGNKSRRENNVKKSTINVESGNISKGLPVPENVILSTNPSQNNQNKIIISKTENIALSNSDSKKPNGKKTSKSCKFLSSKTNKEEEDFLSKLSPSIKKKENMLCYFKKIDKDPEHTVLLDIKRTVQESNQMLKTITETRKPIKGSKRKKLSLQKTTVNNFTDCNENNKNNLEIITSLDETTTRKRKRKDNINIENNILNHKSSLTVSDDRPKRNMKKPVKYVDDLQLSSSDDELRSRTPKKKKKLINSNKHETTAAQNFKDLNVKSSVNLRKYVTKPMKRDLKPKSSSKDNTKLAPIFFGKSHMDVAASEAKQKFLQSGIPDLLKKAISLQKSQTVIANSFYSVVHVQQIDCSLQNIIKPNSIEIDLNLEESDKPMISQENDMKNLLCLNESSEEATEMKYFFKPNEIQSTLREIKESYPDFPVYRTYKTLQSKRKGDNKDFNCIKLDNSSEVLKDSVDTIVCNPDCLCWTDKYKASSTKHIIGNFDSNSELKKWLISWTEHYKSPKNYNDSDSDFCNSDTDSRDNLCMSNNLLILTGPAGCGKTTSVYAVATELAMKVIEVNVSSRRTGKILLQDLQEATQSHKVNRGKGSSAENSQEIVGSVNTKKNKILKNKLKDSPNHTFLSHRSDSLKSQENGRTAMSLILIDDADIVFDQDDGFISAIAQLVQCSKRPVILVTTTLSCPHLQKFLMCGNIIKMNPLLPKMLGTWLDIMCLSDTGICWPGTGAKFLDYFRGDMRKTINCLQFYAFSETQKLSQLNKLDNIITTYNIIDCHEENSRISWADQNSSEVKNDVEQKYSSHSMRNSVWSHFVGNPNNKIYLEYPIDLINIWWSVADLIKDCNEEAEGNKRKLNENSVSYKIFEEISDVLDSISFADCMSFKIKPDTRSNIFSNPWYCSESNSVSERQTLDDVNNFHDVSYNISHQFVKNSVEKLHKRYNFQDADIQYPGLLEQRKREKIISRHETLSSAVNLSSMLDRKAVALDYWSACRSICRIEKNRTDNNSKRNNRFFHYLKSSKVICKNDVFDKLCDSLKPDEAIK